MKIRFIKMFMLLFFINTGVMAKEIIVYKSPFCGCCSAWSKYLENNDFLVIEKKVKNVGIFKKKYGITEKLSSCHTAVVDGYVIEGHVPVEDINRLLKEKPSIKGLTAPGMPQGSPGMEQGKKDRYDVLGIKQDGSTFIYNTHNKK